MRLCYRKMNLLGMGREGVGGGREGLEKVLGKNDEKGV